jgi:hypothetical protein
MATLKEFEEALREYGMTSALAVLEELRERDRDKKRIAAPRRVSARKMTPELAQCIRELHRTTNLTQQEIAFKLGVNQGRVNEVIKHGKWLSGDASCKDAGPETELRSFGADRSARECRIGPGYPSATMALGPNSCSGISERIVIHPITAV